MTLPLVYRLDSQVLRRARERCDLQARGRALASQMQLQHTAEEPPQPPPTGGPLLWGAPCVPVPARQLWWGPEWAGVGGGAWATD